MAEQKFNSPANTDMGAWLYRNKEEAEAAVPGSELMFQSFRHSLNGLDGLAWLDKQGSFNDGDIIEFSNGGLAIRIRKTGKRKTAELDDVKVKVNGNAPVAPTPVDTADEVPF